MSNQQTMQTTLSALHRQANEALAAYLKIFPEEAEQLEEAVRQIATDPGIFSRSTMAGHLTCSVAALNAERTHVLMIHHATLDDWMPPGGHFELEFDSSIWDAACREASEETSIAGLLVHPWSLRAGEDTLLPIPIEIMTHVKAANSKKNEGQHLHHDFLYLAVAPLSSTLTPQLEEVHGVAWWDINQLRTAADPSTRRLATKLERFQLIKSVDPSLTQESQNKAHCRRRP